MKIKTIVDYAEVKIEDIIEYWVKGYKLDVKGYEYSIDQHKGKVIIRVTHTIEDNG